MILSRCGPSSRRCESIQSGPVAQAQISHKLLTRDATCPSVWDFNGDGAPDLVVGAASGQLFVITNHGANESPAFGPLDTLKIEGRPFRIQAGYNGSIQGPNESTWGYVAPAMADPDGDGDGDILYSSVDGYHSFILNRGDSSTPRWSNPKPILIDGRRLRTVWRTRPQLVPEPESGVMDYLDCEALPSA